MRFCWLWFVAFRGAADTPRTLRILNPLKLLAIWKRVFDLEFVKEGQE